MRPVDEINRLIKEENWNGLASELDQYRGKFAVVYFLRAVALMPGHSRSDPFLERVIEELGKRLHIL